MLIHIANYMDSDRRTATAGEDMPLGCVTVHTPDAAGLQRKLMKITSAGDIKPGRVGIAFKVSADPRQVTSSTVNADSGLDFGTRVVSIKEGDMIVEVRRGAMVEYDVSLLDATLDPARAGVLPVVGEELGIDPATALFCKNNKAGAIVAPVLGVVFELRGSKKVVVELVEVS